MTERRPFRIARTLTAAAILALAAFAAQAQPYYVLRANGDARTIIDPSAIEQVPGGAVRKTWTVTVQRNLVGGSAPQPGYVRSVNEYDCAQQTMRWRNFTAYSRSGSPLASRTNPSQDWEAVTPRSGALVEWRVVCGLSAGDSVVSAASVAKLVVALMAAFDLPPAAPAPAITPAPVAAKR
jgi:hypothetical protein